MLVTPVTNIIQVFGDLIITNSMQVRNDLTFLDLTVQQIEYLNKKYSLFLQYFSTSQHFDEYFKGTMPMCLSS